MRLFRLLQIVSVTFVLGACVQSAPRGGGDVLVLGDSILAWNAGQDAAIPDVMRRSLMRDVTSRAVSGAQFDNPSALRGAVGFDIQRQFPGGRWNWVVINGGANDLSKDCGCGACPGSVNALIGADATRGAIPAFIQKVRTETRASVIWMGYYAGSGSGPFAGCRSDLVEIEARVARFAARQAGVFFVDAEDVINRADRSLFAGDNVHPSPKGSAVIGNWVASQITAIDSRSQTQP